MSWDPNKAKVRVSRRVQLSRNSSLSILLFSIQAQFRLAAQKLGQLQGKFESQAQITKGDIVTLLRQGNIGLARAKAEAVIRDEVHTDLLQTLEVYLEVVLEQFSEIEKKYTTFCCVIDSSHTYHTIRLIPSPPLVEAASGIIYAAPTLGIRGVYALSIQT